jgi:hypothetical protein
MSDRDQPTSPARGLGSGLTLVYLLAAVAVIAAWVPLATSDIASLRGLWDPKAIRIVLGLCGLLAVGYAVMRSRRLRQDGLDLDREIQALREKGDVTFARIAEKLDKLNERDR